MYLQVIEVIGIICAILVTNIAIECSWRFAYQHVIDIVILVQALEFAFSICASMVNWLWLIAIHFDLYEI